MVPTKLARMFFQPSITKTPRNPSKNVQVGYVDITYGTHKFMSWSSPSQKTEHIPSMEEEHIFFSATCKLD